MKITRYAMMLAAATGLLSACQKLDEVKAYDPDKVVAPVLHALPGEIVITPDNMGSTQTFTWDAADFGVRTQINYSIEASYNDGAKLVLFTGMNGTSSEQTYESLNNILALSVEDGGLGVPSGEPTDVDFYISATIGTDFEKFYSAPATVRMTVTTAERTYPQVWVIGDYCGWNFDNAQGLFCFSGDEVTYEAIVDLGEKAANGFKLSGEAGWNDACNWGTDDDAAAPETEAPSITLISSSGSGNIMVYSKRFYRFVFDRSTLTLSNKLSFNSMGIIGDATPGGWDTDTEMNFDTQKQRFWVDVTLTAGEFKFRADNDWAINFGGADGRLSQNGDNIKATAGNYRVYATLNNSAEITYELNAGDYGTGGGEEPDPGPEKADWYIHGQTVATPDWGPTAMESASSNIVAYKAAGVEVAANSEFLFKSGDESQWIGADAAFAGSSPYTCTIGSAFKVSADKVNAVIAEAGTYDYWLLPEAGRAYVMAAGAKPELVADTWGLVGNITGWGDLGDFSMSEEGEAPALHDGAFDASYAWELHHLLNDIAQGRKSAADLRAYVARDAAAMPREAFRLMFTSNHDENSWAGTEFERMGDAARVMAFLTFTLPNGQPLVYTGQEMGFDHRFEFFEKDPVPAWEHNGFTDFYTALIRLRHENPALAAGERGGQAAYPLGERTPDGLMLFSRTAGGNEVTVAANLSAEEVAFDLPFEGSRREFFTGKEYTGGTRTVLPAWQWLVFAQDRR